MRVGKIGVAVIGLVPFNVYGECTPTPDCASIGYTETSCEGDYLACPFDSTKLKCIPCDSSYRYDCSGDDFTGGTGSACGGKYVACECSSSDYVFDNGQCVCNPSCKVGAIYYSDNSCSACVDSTKTAIGVVIKDNELVMTQKLISMTWGGYGTNISGITETTDSSVAKTDLNGKANTLAIISELTNGTASNTAAIYCNSYKTDGTNAGDWYLPAAGELYTYASANYHKIYATMRKLNWGFDNLWFWSSSEYNSKLAWRWYSGNLGSADKTYTSYITCFMAL